MRTGMKSSTRILLNLGLLSLLTFGVATSGESGLLEDLERLTFDRIERFESEQEFDNWVRELYAVRRAHANRGCGGVAIGCADAGMEAPKENGEESITNTQEDGVDEGGIIKAAGEYFVILRRGRIFTVRQGSEDQDDLLPVAQIDAYPDGWTQGSWYDEMLVHGDRIVVIGYSYRVSATEVGLFRLGEDGSLAHEDTFFISSNDYFSSRNYASRLVDGTLIFYMPHRLFVQEGWGREELSLPSTMRWVSGDRTTPWEPILAKDDIYTPVQGTINPALHTVVYCDLGADDFDCSAKAVVGPFARSFYVTRDHVYLWVAPPWEARRAEGGDSLPSYFYRLPLGDDDVVALRAHGMPIDQFSFRESPDEHINVLLTASGGGDWMWNPEYADGEMALLRVPLDAMTKEAPEVSEDDYTIVPAPELGSIQNRFVGDHLLWGSSTWSGTQSHHRVYVMPFADPDLVHDLALDHQVERIEALGAAAMVIGARGDDLVFSSIELGEEPAVVSTYEQEDAVQGETRSHGFFYRPSPSGGGLLGLPIRHFGGRWSHLVHGSAEVRFLRVDENLGLETIGALAAADEAQIDDACEYSCVDWYGNARPIFYRGRIFALMGYEMVEGELESDELEELRRINFFVGE